MKKFGLDVLTDWLILMSCLTLSCYFMIEVRESHSLYLHIHILAFIVIFYILFFKYEYFLNRPIWFIYGILAGTTI